MTAVSGVSSHVHNHDDPSFLPFGDAVRHTFAKATIAGDPLFTTDVDADELWEAYLSGYTTPHDRQLHNCNCCKSFIKRYGALVTIEGNGAIREVMWDVVGTPAYFAPSVANMVALIRKANVNGVFVSADKVWGNAKTGDWNHFAVTPPASILHKNRALEPHQVMAQKKQDFGTLSHGLADYPREVVASALGLIQAEALFRSEKVLGPAAFLLALHDAYTGKDRKRRANYIWKAVATAPVGFATPRSGVIGTLLDDLKEGLPVEDVRRKFADKLDPLKYQRPQTEASDGNIAQAEKLVEKMGIAPSLERRFARFEEVTTVWTPTPDIPVARGGVFGSLKGSKTPASGGIAIPVQNITWEKFARTVLAGAKSMKVQLNVARQPFAALVTAVNADAPPIFQWDYEEARNPFSWYVYNGGSLPRDWNLAPGWVDVTGITLKPSMWGGEDKHRNQGNGALFLLKGAVDQRQSGLALFPECLKAELHPIRKTIENFSRRGMLAGREEASACGLLFGREGNTAIVRVTTEHGTADYRIDRWD